MRQLNDENARWNSPKHGEPDQTSILMRARLLQSSAQLADGFNSLSEYDLSTQVRTPHPGSAVRGHVDSRFLMERRAFDDFG